MKASFSIAALVSAGRHPVSGTPRACRGDAVAMALGMSLAGRALRVVYAGGDQEPALRDYMAYGASRIDVLRADASQNPIPILAKAVACADVILTGSAAEQGAGSGLLPYVLAEALGRPVVANVLGVKLEQDGERTVARIRQFLPKGQRRQLVCPVPLVVAVHPFTPVRLDYAYARRISGRLDVAQADYPADGAMQPSWTVEATPRRPVRLQAQDKKAGHARLLSAIMSEAKNGVVAFEGTTVDKAQVVLNYLREHRLVDF